MKKVRTIIPKHRAHTYLGWSRRTLDNRIKSGELPPPMVTGPRTRGYFEDVLAEIQEKFAQQVGGPSATDRP